MTPTNVYVDGFNLYYGCLKGSPWKWLDLEMLAQRLVPRGHEVHRIRYFTARVGGRANDQGSPVRQQAYLRALATLPRLEIVFGHFLTTTVCMPLAAPMPGRPRTVRVVKTEEKGSDVNLASHLLLDTFRRDCGAALVISNDSDLLSPIRMARREFGLVVGVGCPHPRPSQVLLREASFFRSIRPGALRASQFPERLWDARGEIVKPRAW